MIGSGGRLRVEVKTVNHRHFNPALKLPGELAAIEGELREALRKEFDRGHVAVSVRWTEWTQRSATLSVDLGTNLAGPRKVGALGVCASRSSSLPSARALTSPTTSTWAEARCQGAIGGQHREMTVYLDQSY